MSTATMTNNLLDAFIDMMQQFLEAMEETFPECLRVKQYRIGLAVRLAQCEDDDAIRELTTDAITSYHESMVAYYSRCVERDESLIYEPIDLMLNIDLPSKWTPDLHPDTKNAIWEFITKLNEFSNLYNMYAKVPTGMMTSIESMAHSIAAQIGSGEMSLSDLNLQTMSEQVMRSINGDDLRQFADTLQSGDVFENMTNMYAMVSSMMRSQSM
jgi:hypothetical protein